MQKTSNYLVDTLQSKISQKEVKFLTGNNTGKNTKLRKRVRYDDSSLYQQQVVLST